MDRLDVSLGHSIWHSDAIADYGPDVYQGPGPGVIDLIFAQHRHTLHHSHQVTNILIHVDGDKAGRDTRRSALPQSAEDPVRGRLRLLATYRATPRIARLYGSAT
ncbi:nuclear transport factor 2 family protein [Novosphingobium sp.]|jgi:hypothetical protein|uniref:nuclear transport factor 2 family protein n=1 Tax=Novosphingobium sp. TaxID=1874826 RepID=UPI002FE08A93